MRLFVRRVLLATARARAYTGRIVFASICDKMFDIDENLG